MNERVDEKRYRIVTPDAYRCGYLELRGVIARERKFKLVKKLDDGNYLVEEPEIPRGGSDE